MVDQITGDLEDLFRNHLFGAENSNISNLGARIFVICEGAVYKYKKLKKGELEWNISDASVLVVHLPLKSFVEEFEDLGGWTLVLSSSRKVESCFCLTDHSNVRSQGSLLSVAYKVTVVNQFDILTLSFLQQEYRIAFFVDKITAIEIEVSSRGQLLFGF